MYFITVCTANKACILGNVIPGQTAAESSVQLSSIGLIVQDAITAIPTRYHDVYIPKYVIMPNHIHLLLELKMDVSPDVTVSRIIQQLKRIASKQAGFSVWQSHFHDHVIRGEQDFDEIWNYIDNNPANWVLKRDPDMN